MSLNLEWLITFQRLAREKSFSETAHSLGIAQPTVTMRIKKLEEMTGHILVQRAGQHVTLTEAGETFLSYVKRILRVIESGKEDIQRSSLSGKPLIRVAATSSISAYFLPDFLTLWYKRHPHISVSVSSSSTQEVMDRIYDSICDLGIIRGNTFNSYFQAIKLYQDPVVLVLSPEHPFCARSGSDPTDSIPISELSQEPFIVYRSKSWSFILDWFRRHGHAPRVSAEVTHVATVKKLIQSQIGVGFLPYSCVKEEYEQRHLHIIPIDPCGRLTLPTQLVTRVDSEEDRKEYKSLFLQSLIEYTASFPGGLS